jgi:hypothetical protein
MRYIPEDSRFYSQWYHWNFSLTLSFPPHYSASNRNEYQEYFLGCNGGRFLRLTTLPLSRAIVMKSGSFTSWNSQGLSRLVQGLLYLFTGERRVRKWVLRIEQPRRQWTFFELCGMTEYGCLVEKNGTGNACGHSKVHNCHPVLLLPSTKGNRVS